MSADGNPIREDASLETPHVSTRAVWMSVLGFLLFTVLAMVGLHVFFGDKLGRHPELETVFKEPRLQSQPRGDRYEVEAAQQARLDHGPMSIAEAMARIAARGDKAFDPVDELGKDAP